MIVRALLAIGLFATTMACAAIPDLSFTDASIPDGAPGVDGAAPPYDGAAPPYDGGGPADAGSNDDADTTPDASTDGAPPKPDSGTTCPPAGAPAIAECCPDGVTPCVGLGCQSCSSCNCPAGDYCCATKNAGGKIKTNCATDPSSKSCALM
jgi:hypothetical protein